LTTQILKGTRKLKKIKSEMSDFFGVNPLKTTSVTGKLDKSEFSANVCIRNNDLCVGNWALSLSDIVLSYPANFSLSTSLLFDISCNFVQGYSFTATKTVSLTNVSLIKFYIDPKPKINVSYLPQRWFNINNPHEVITIKLNPWPSQKNLTSNDKKLLSDTSICFTLLFKRIN